MQSAAIITFHRVIFFDGKSILRFRISLQNLKKKNGFFLFLILFESFLCDLKFILWKNHIFGILKYVPECSLKSHIV